MFHFQDVFLLAFTEIAADSEGRQHFEPKLQHFKLKIHHHLCFFSHLVTETTELYQFMFENLPFFLKKISTKNIVLGPDTL